MSQYAPFGWTGLYLDDYTGKYHAHHRDYSPIHARWLSEDPAGYADGMNLYAAYMGVNGRDPSGLALYAFDGTGTDKDNASWNVNDNKSPYTNIAIIYDLYKGIREYRWGVGTRTTKAAGNAGGWGWDERVDQMMKLFDANYKADPSDPIDIIGFSRGAGMARDFSNRILKKYPKARVRFLGIFDTVAQRGVADRFNINGVDLDIHPRVDYVAHAVAKNEYRGLFPLTSVGDCYWQSKTLAALLPGFLGNNMGNNAFDPDEFISFKGKKVYEKAFRGAHSDVGGGYKDYRNMEALEWMIKQAKSRGVPLADLKTWTYYNKLKGKKIGLKVFTPHDSRWFILDFLQGDRVIFPGNIKVKKIK
jgi:RHS repeat-associated protein